VSTRAVAVSLAWAVLPAAVAAQSHYPPPSDPAPFSCADTSVTRWLPADNSADRSAIEARELYEHALARKYAPILRFAPSERYFPTIPFWPAFLDTMPTDTTPAGDTVPVLVTSSGHFGKARPDGTRPELPAIAAVRHAYEGALNLSARPYELKLPIPVVFYRVCDFIAPVPQTPVPGDSSEPARAKAEELENLLPNGENGPFAAPFHRLNGWNQRFSALA